MNFKTASTLQETKNEKERKGPVLAVSSTE
jgi:hypothetical protein